MHPSALLDLDSQFPADACERRVRDVFVVDPEGLYHGLIDIQDVKGLLNQPHDELTVDDVERRDVPSLGAELPLSEAMPIFFRHDLDELPVVDATGRLVGVLSERDVIAAFHREVLRKESPFTRVESGEGPDKRVDFLELPEGLRIGAVGVGERFGGKTLRELDLPARFGVTVVAVDVWDAPTQRAKRSPPRADLVVHAEDRLIVLGPDASIADLTGPGNPV